MTNTLKDKFWDRVEDGMTVMIGADGGRAVPMTIFKDEDDPAPALWIIAAKGTDLATAAQGGASAQSILSSSDQSLYARIEGRVRHEQDKSKLDKFWNGIVGAWFDGKQDPDVQLVRLDLAEAEVWAGPGSVKFFYEIAKANLSDTKPDAGEHGTIKF